jgi:hypothetical protein
MIFFNRPDLNFTIENDSLYLTFSNEPILHVYALGDSIIWERSIDINPIDFKLMPGQKTPVTYQEMTKMFEAKIHGIYSDSKHIMISYHGGIDGDTFVNNNLKERENFFRYPEFLNSYLKIYRFGYGWSNEILVPSKIDFILNIESVDQPFYALRDDDFLSGKNKTMSLSINFNWSKNKTINWYKSKISLTQFCIELKREGIRSLPNLFFQVLREVAAIFVLSHQIWHWQLQQRPVLGRPHQRQVVSLQVY